MSPCTPVIASTLASQGRVVGCHSLPSQLLPRAWRLQPPLRGLICDPRWLWRWPLSLGYSLARSWFWFETHSLCWRSRLLRLRRAWQRLPRELPCSEEAHVAQPRNLRTPVAPRGPPCSGRAHQRPELLLRRRGPL
jgi:hypothetical protein